ncbi:hypothetical protein [Bacillus sp. M6-12]|uniref:hypothetical protein n=1 Tax=Bacillus sp. M6-12 TaxID=2054166 RepID=UPI000C7909E7|nr:hypothetical protein [Bacillus sp. M6-12]
MHEVTLAEMFESSDYTSVLHLKHALIHNKSAGFVFFKEDISSLDWGTPFEFYHYFTSGGIEYSNAFPVPIKVFYENLRIAPRFNFLMRYYNEYYDENNLPSEGFFNSLMVFPARHFAWFYKTTNERETL